MSIEIVDLPMKHVDFPVRFVKIYQARYKINMENILCF